MSQGNDTIPIFRSRLLKERAFHIEAMKAVDGKLAMLDEMEREAKKSIGGRTEGTNDGVRESTLRGLTLTPATLRALEAMSLLGKHRMSQISEFMLANGFAPNNSPQNFKGSLNTILKRLAETKRISTELNQRGERVYWVLPGQELLR